MGRKFYTISNCVCLVCDTEIPIPRMKGSLRKKRHIKDMYCPVCKCKRQFKEITYQDNYKNLDGEIVNGKWDKKEGK